ncbi:unnamed protein product [Rotaria sp. Silwood1]|nr:unnamed protein product [Rotaria sp. Silwood1]
MCTIGNAFIKSNVIPNYERPSPTSSNETKIEEVSVPEAIELNGTNINFGRGGLRTSIRCAKTRSPH